MLLCTCEINFKNKNKPKGKIINWNFTKIKKLCHQKDTFKEVKYASHSLLKNICKIYLINNWYLEF